MLLLMLHVNDSVAIALLQDKCFHNCLVYSFSFLFLTEEHESVDDITGFYSKAVRAASVQQNIWITSGGICWKQCEQQYDYIFF